MNYRLSCAVVRPMKKCGYILEKDGRMLSEKVISLPDENVKKCALEVLYWGIKSARGLIKHEDLLMIELQNTHLVDWLLGEKDYAGYEDYLEKVFSVLEMLDCKYKVVCVPNNYASVYVKENSISRVKTASVKDMMSDLE